MGGPRQVQRGQLIHESVFENIKKTNITPKALLYDSLDWNNTEEFRNKELIERDIYSNASTLMHELGEKNEVSEVDANTLLTLLASGE
jgi:RNA polymerase-interacting CarD/CdnL/TRCF family regulator